jgi:serine/threonine-protein kinase RsbW
VDHGATNPLHLQLHLARASCSVPLARRVAESLLRALHVADTAREDILIALSEACTNAVTHAVASTGYTVTVAIANHQCDVCVADDGPGFAVPTRHRRPATAAPGGRGLFLIATLSDQLHIHSDTNSGTILRFLKRLPPPLNL